MNQCDSKPEPYGSRCTSAGRPEAAAPFMHNIEVSAAKMQHSVRDRDGDGFEGNPPRPFQDNFTGGFARVSVAGRFCAAFSIFYVLALYQEGSAVKIKLDGNNRKLGMRELGFVHCLATGTYGLQASLQTSIFEEHQFGW